MSAGSGSGSGLRSGSRSQSEERAEGAAAGSRADFRFACEDCAHFVADAGVCANGYPNAAHRRAAPRITFCKEFELS